MPDHVTVPVYCKDAVIELTGVAPATGWVTPEMVARVTGARSAVAANTAVITPELAEFVAVAASTVKKFEAMPESV